MKWLEKNGMLLNVDHIIKIKTYGKGEVAPQARIVIHVNEDENVFLNYDTNDEMWDEYDHFRQLLMGDVPYKNDIKQKLVDIMNAISNEVEF